VLCGKAVTAMWVFPQVLSSGVPGGGSNPPQEKICNCLVFLFHHPN
jgi:hypothetical protein